MIMYNVTVSVDPEISDDWLNWMKEIHIPEVMGTELFDSYKIFKVLLQQDETLTFSVQYFTGTMAKLQQYHAIHAAGLQAKHLERYGDKVAAFRTILESV